MQEARAKGSCPEAGQDSPAALVEAAGRAVPNVDQLQGGNVWKVQCENTVWEYDSLDDIVKALWYDRGYMNDELPECLHSNCGKHHVVTCNDEVISITLNQAGLLERLNASILVGARLLEKE